MANQITPNPSVPSQVVAEVKFPKFINNLGIIPTSYKDSMSYYECLAWLCKFLEEQVIPTVNENGEAVKELQALYIELNGYVTNYFDNLDVQEEINNKLDEMVKDGTLQEIIADYLNSKAVFGFDSVADMKEASNLINGSYAKTLGFYEINDGGSAIYKIRNITNDDVVDNASIISIEDNTLIAELITTDYITVEQFGAKGDGITDDSNAIEKALNYVNNEKVLFHNKTYLCNVEVEKGNISIDGQNASLKSNPTNEYPVIKFKGTENNIISNINIENLTINGNKNNTSKTVDCHGMVFVYANEINLNNITIYDVFRCSQYFNVIENLHVNNLKCYNGGILNNPTYGCVMVEIHNTINADFENVIFDNYYGEGYLIRNSKNVSVNNFKCSNSTRAGNNAFTTDDCENIILSNFVIDTIAHQGVEINSTLYYKIINGIISNCQRNGLLISTFSTVTPKSSEKGIIDNIKLLNNNLSESTDTFDVYGIGIKNTKISNISATRLKLSKETSNNITCDNNIIENSTITYIFLIGNASNGLTGLIIDNVLPLGNITADPYSSYSLKTKKQFSYYHEKTLANGSSETLTLPVPQNINVNAIIILESIFTSDPNQRTSKIYGCSIIGVNAGDISLTELHSQNGSVAGRPVTITKGTNNTLIVTNSSGVQVKYFIDIRGFSTNS